VKIVKKFIALFALVAFVTVLGGMALAQDTRTPAQKLASGRKYLKTLDAKIIRYRKLGNAKVVKNLKAQKVSTIARMKRWKAQVEASVAPPPPPRPVAPPPPPRRVVRPAPAPAAGLFGWGLLTSADIGYITGDSKTASILAGGSLVFDDPLAIGAMLGLSADAVNYKVGLGLTYGKDRNDNTFNAILITADGILNFPAEMMGGVASYVGAQLNYPVYKTDVAGTYGALLYVGIKGDVGLGGLSYAELGYGAIRREGFSTKGIDIKFGQEILL
jgi:hypothetical protein